MNELTGLPEAQYGIRVSGASLTLDHNEIFHDLDFVAAPGKFTCILGPSGVGKTTLLKMIAGLLPPETAAISDDNGQPLGDHVAWMAQRDLLLPWLSVLDNVCLGARLRGDLRQDSKRACDQGMALLDAVGLKAVAHQLPDTLSGGMRQRAALARTLMENRPIILMDEPFSAVDPLTRIALQDLAARMLVGKTVVLVTHDPLEALRLGHCVYVLNGSPARLTTIDVPDIDWPRRVDAPEVLARQAEILCALASQTDETP